MVNGKTMGLICVFMCKENMHKHFVTLVLMLMNLGGSKWESESVSAADLHNHAHTMCK